MRPIPNGGNQAVLERIDVAIFDVTRVVGFVTDQVLPEAALPDAAIATRQANGAEPLLLRQSLGNTGTDTPLPLGAGATAG